MCSMVNREHSERELTKYLGQNIPGYPNWESDPKDEPDTQGWSSEYLYWKEIFARFGRNIQHPPDTHTIVEIDMCLLVYHLI